MKITAPNLKALPGGVTPLFDQDLLASIKVSKPLENEIIGLLNALKIKVCEKLEQESEQNTKGIMSELLENIELDEYNIRNKDLSEDEIKDIAFFYTGYRKIMKQEESFL